MYINYLGIGDSTKTVFKLRLVGQDPYDKPLETREEAQAFADKIASIITRGRDTEAPIILFAPEEFHSKTDKKCLAFHTNLKGLSKHGIVIVFPDGRNEGVIVHEVVHAFMPEHGHGDKFTEAHRCVLEKVYEKEMKILDTALDMVKGLRKETAWA